MQTKTYFASSVPAALDIARKELGQEAMLVGSRPSPRDARSFGRLEVTFAYDPSELEAGLPPREPAQAPFEAARPKFTLSQPRTSPDMVDIRQELAALRTAIRQGPGTMNVAEPPSRGMDRVVERLVNRGLAHETARKIANAAGQRPEPVQAAVRNELIERIGVRPFEDWKPGESRSIAFLGAPGRGKTSSLVKVAIRYGLAAKVPVRIYSAGVHQVGAAEQLARYSSILGVPFNSFETLEALHLSLMGERWKGLALIDTPGLSPADGEELNGWERVFRAHPYLERHLVLRADSRSADISHMLTRFSPLQPSHLLFTGLDEAVDHAALIETAIQSQLPLCFAGTGPRIPEDLAVVDANALVRNIWADQAMSAAA